MPNGVSGLDCRMLRDPHACLLLVHQQQGPVVLWSAHGDPGADQPDLRARVLSCNYRPFLQPDAQDIPH